MRELVVIVAPSPACGGGLGWGDYVSRKEERTYDFLQNSPLPTPPPQAEEGIIGGIIIPAQLNPIPFSNSKTLLGQEFPYAIYDMRAETGVCLNLEALAIVAGTIQQGGKLYLLCPDWHNLPKQIDYDALRWNANAPITTPNFYRYFQQLVAELGFKTQTDFGKLPKKRDIATEKPLQLTTDQQNILQNLPVSTADIHLITAPRGRGKSTLLGKLAEQLSANHKVLITARSHSALPNFWKQIEGKNIPFFAPDNLLQQIENKAISSNCWLFIDEAASLPLPMLHRFCTYFAKVVLTTTTQNYEGTGRGFSLKFLPQLQRYYQQWQLTTPLRWGENDPLERFINRLLLLDEKMDVCNTSLQKIATTGQISAEICKKIAFYHLLAQAHYKTTPTDLRRLFDAPDQHLFSLEQNGKLIAGCWAMNEGGLSDELTQAIWRGERRPQGSLVAQYLCFQGNLPNACRLKSVRISRIAVQPELQRQGYGKQLVEQFCKTSPKTAPVADYISVSFGLNNELLRFWTSCGFRLVQITPTVEASSGYHSAMMIFPCSEQGNAFVEKACQQFERDFSLQPFFSSFTDILQISEKILPIATALLPADWANLHGFAHAQRSFSACYVSLKRLALAYPTEFVELAAFFSSHTATLPPYKKQWIADLRSQIRQKLSILNATADGFPNL